MAPLIQPVTPLQGLINYLTLREACKMKRLFGFDRRGLMKIDNGLPKK
jgi:hypothetical protein